MRKRTNRHASKSRLPLNLSLSPDAVERVKLHALVKRTSVSQLIEGLILSQLTGLAIHQRTCAAAGEGGQTSGE